MLAAIHQLNTKVKMEEVQTVPSAGFSPQPDPYESEYMTKFAHQNQNQSQNHHHHQTLNYAPILTSGVEDSSSYCNLADTFDLSLLGDTYDDHDMATVPSPSSWSQSASLEQTSWQQMSLYAPSPSRDFRAFSPDCKPALSPVHPFSPSGSSCGGDSSFLQIHSPSTPGSVHSGMGGGDMTSINCSAAEQQQMACDRHLLLRQCLEDTTFQRKYNFKPLDLPTASLMTENSGSIREIGRTPSPAENVGNLELNQIEPVFSMAFEHIRSDIQNVCSVLAISPDPMQWSGCDVQTWLTHTLHSVPQPGGVGVHVNATIQQFWNLDGRSLCSFDENEFRLRDPVSGDRLFSHLELWKMLQNQNQNQHHNSQSRNCSSQQLSHSSPVQQHHHHQQQQRQSDFPMSLNVNVNNNNVFNLEQLLLSPSLASPSSSLCGDITQPATPCDAQLTSHVPEVSTPASSSSLTTIGHQGTGSVSPSLEHVRSPSSASSSSSSNFSSPNAPEHMNTDDDEEEEEEEEEDKKPVVGKSGTTTTTTTKGTGTNGPKSGAHIHLWQFLKELLASPQQHGSCIRWLDQSRGVFKIEDSVRVARLWGLRKNRPAMNYDKLSRSIRQYYRKGIMKKTERSQRLVYQFCHPYGL